LARISGRPSLWRFTVLPLQRPLPRYCSCFSFQPPQKSNYLAIAIPSGLFFLIAKGMLLVVGGLPYPPETVLQKNQSSPELEKNGGF